LHVSEKKGLRANAERTREWTLRNKQDTLRKGSSKEARKKGGRGGSRINHEDFGGGLRMKIGGEVRSERRTLWWVGVSRGVKVRFQRKGERKYTSRPRRPILAVIKHPKCQQRKKGRERVETGRVAKQKLSHKRKMASPSCSHVRVAGFKKRSGSEKWTTNSTSDSLGLKLLNQGCRPQKCRIHTKGGLKFQHCGVGKKKKAFVSPGSDAAGKGKGGDRKNAAKTRAAGEKKSLEGNVWPGWKGGPKALEMYGLNGVDREK